MMVIDEGRSDGSVNLCRVYGWSIDTYAVFSAMDFSYITISLD
jgi:hypothetical protein